MTIRYHYNVFMASALVNKYGHFVVDGVWKEWTTWSECSLTCGGGERRRSRSCIPPLHGGKDCDGPSMNVEACNEQPCPGML